MSSGFKILPEWYSGNELCACGCGEKTRISDKSDKSRGQIKGYPQKYIAGHQGRDSIKIAAKVSIEVRRNNADRRSTEKSDPNPDGLCMCGCRSRN